MDKAEKERGLKQAGNGSSSYAPSTLRSEGNGRKRDRKNESRLKQISALATIDYACSDGCVECARIVKRGDLGDQIGFSGVFMFRKG